MINSDNCGGKAVIEKTIEVIGEENYLLAMAYWYENNDCSFEEMINISGEYFLIRSILWEETREGYEHWHALHVKIKKGWLNK